MSLSQSDAHGEGDILTDTSANVTLTTARIPSEVKVGESFSTLSLVTEDVVDEYKMMVERWYMIYNGAWRTNHVKNTFLFDEKLPQFAVKNGRKSVNFIPFYCHGYWRGDLEIRIQINSNKFQCGQLQAAWYYGFKNDDSWEQRKNIYCLSQSLHGIIDAGGSNEVILEVPFRNQNPILNTRANGICDNLDLGNLLISVLAPLRVNSGGVNEVPFMVWMRSTNNQFTSTIAPDIGAVNPQMETALTVIAAEKLLNYVGSNADNPPLNAGVNYVIPTGTTSWSFGNNYVEPINGLRLDAAAQTTRIDEINDNSSVISVARIFGLIKSFEWSTSHVIGTILRSYPAVPDMGNDYYFQAQMADGEYQATYAYPPVFVISSCFAQWRGSLEMRFDFVSTAFHTGRLLIGYIPTVEVSFRPTLEQLKNSLHVVYDLQESRSYTFVIPYVNRSVWYRRNRNMSGEQHLPFTTGSVYAVVMNRLNCPETVSSTIEINVYVRAGDSYEISVPVQPSIGTCYRRRVLVTSQTVFKADNEDLTSGLYVGTWNDFPNKLVLRWGTLAGRIANFAGVEKLFKTRERGVYFQNTDRSLTCLTKVLSGQCQNLVAEYFVILKRADTWTAFVCSDELNAANAWAAELGDKFPGERGKMTTKDPLDFVMSTDCPQSNPWADTKPLLLYKKKAMSNFVDPQMERTNVVNIVSTPNKLETTNCGVSVFGEHFADIKTLMRRYQRYGTFTIGEIGPLHKSGVLCTLPTFPQGINLSLFDVDYDYVNNKCRNGFIPIILSGFKYYRGSLRYKIVFPATFGMHVWVQHRPDLFGISYSIEKPGPEDAELDMLAHNYAMYMQPGVVNNVMEIEVPFYQTGIFGLLGKKEKIDQYKYYYGNGLLVVGYFFPESSTSLLKNGMLSFFYSVGDDFQCNTFQGFPPMLDASNISEDIPTNFTMVEPQMGKFSEFFEKRIQNKVDDVIDNSAIIKRMNEMVSSLIESFAKIFADLVSAEQIKTFCVFLGSQIAHLANNFCARTIAIVIVSVLTYIGIRIVDVCGEITLMLEKVLSYFERDSYKELSNRSNVVNPQSDLMLEEEHFSQYISAFYTSICLFFGVKNASGCETKLQFFKNLFTKDLSIAFRNGNGLFVFLKNHFYVARSIMKSIINCIHPGIETCNIFADENGVGFAYLKEVDELVDANVVSEQMNDPYYIEAVAANEITGRELLISALEQHDDVDNVLIGSLEKAINKIHALGVELKNRGRYPTLRRKPFHLYVAGPPGVGKTFMIDKLAKELISNVLPGYKIEPNFICHVDCGSKFWNQCNGKQPVLCFDDLWAVKGGIAFDEMLIHYMALHSDIPFSPPKAEVGEKNMLYAPEFVISTSNETYPSFINAFDAAINRRRSMLVSVEMAPLTPELRPNCPHCRGVPIEAVGIEHLFDYHHLVFFVHPDVINSSTVDQLTPIDFYTFQSLCIRNAQAHYQKHKSIYEQKLRYFEESYVPITGDTLEMRMARREFGFKNYFEKLTNNIEFGPSYRERFTEYVKETVGNLSQRLFHMRTGDEIFMSKFLKPQMEEPSTSTSGPELLPGDTKAKMQKVRENIEIKLCALVPPIMYKHGEAGKFEMEDFDPIFLEEISACCEHEMRKECSKTQEVAKFTYENFINYLIINSDCVHTTDKFFNSNYGTGIFFCGGNHIKEDFVCKRFCVMNYSIKKKFYEKWLNSSFPKRTYLVRKIYSKLPKYFSEKIDGGRTVLGTIKMIAEYIKIKLEKYIHNMTALVKKTYCFVTGAIGSFIDIFKDWFKYLLPILIPWGMYKYSIGGANSINVYHHELEPQGKNYGTPQPGRVVKIAKVREAKPQNVSQQANVVEKKIFENMVFIHVEFLKNGKLMQQKWRCLMLGVRKLLFIRHYYEMAQHLEQFGAIYHFSYADDAVNRIRGGGKIPLRLLDCPFQYLTYGDGENNSNLMIIELPGTIKPAKNITKFIAKSVEHQYVGERVWFLRVDEPTTAMKLLNERRGAYTVNPPSCGGVAVSMTDCYTYEMSKDGYCGAIILAPNLERPIIGIHVAGKAGVFGIAEPLTQESYVEFYNKEKIIDIADIKLQNVELSEVNLTTVLYPRGVVEPYYAHHQAPGTQYIPSGIHGVFEVRTEPTPLSEKDERMAGQSPLERGSNKHGLISFPFEQKVVDIVKNDFQEKLFNVVQPLKRNFGVLTLEEAIIGDPYIPELSPLEWSSSEGFPLVKERPRGVKGKRWLFELDETGGSLKLLGINQKLSDILAIHQKMRERGIIPTSVFTDICKDETLPFAKTKAGKTRVFSTAPVQFIIQFRQYYGHFMAAYRRARLSAEHAIGIDPHGIDWTILFQHIIKHGKYVIAGDYSHFGYTLSAQFVSAAFDIMIAWYEYHQIEKTNFEEEHRIRCVFKNEILNTYRLCKNTVYQSACGIPSGFPATDIVNSMVNCMYVRAAWHALVTSDMYLFNQHVTLVVYGDDILMNVGEKYLEKFNAQTMRDFFSKYNISFTDVNDKGEPVAYRDIEEATFLKSRFKPHPFRARIRTAALDKLSVEGAANWIHSHDDVYTATVENAKQCLELGHGHGHEYFEWLYNSIKKKIKENYGENFSYSNWYEIDRRRYDDD